MVQDVYAQQAAVLAFPLLQFTNTAFRPQVGFIDYERFQDLVMEGVRSSFADASAIATTATNGNSVSMSDAALRTTSDANCNSEQFLRRKVKEHWKYLAIDFKHMADKEGNMAPPVLRKVLYKFDILPSEDMWADVCTRMDEDGDGFISFQVREMSSRPRSWTNFSLL